MATTLSFLIRDGLEGDLEACAGLDHDYTTEYVWQVNVTQETGHWHVTLKPEHLPRTMPVQYPVDTHRLRLALPDDQCFLVAVNRDSGDVLGYLTMRNQRPHRIGMIQDLVVSRPVRGNRIAHRLLNIARQWAREHDLVQMMIETQTKNYPGILFCQQAGFAFCGFNDRYFENGDIAVFFSQSLR